MLLALHSQHPRSGKDTAANHLVAKHGFHKDSFGIEIYNEVAPAFGVTIDQLGLNHWKTAPVHQLSLQFCTDQGFIDTIVPLLLPYYTSPGRHHKVMTEARSSRFILQRWATEYRRKQDIHYWVNKLDDRLVGVLDGSEPDKDIVISDLREEHEYEYLRDTAENYGLRFRVIEIYRDGTVGSTRSSDAGIHPHHIHTRMENINGKPEILLRAISTTVTNIKGIV